MHPLHDVVGQELRWVKPRWSKLQFELRAGETVVATLAWTGASRALGEWSGGRYRLSREGWLRPRVIVRDESAATDDSVATFMQRGGTLTLAGGRALVWKKPKRWTTERVWADGENPELVRFRPERADAVVTIQAVAAALPELPLLLLLGQYLLVLASQDAAAATSAAIVPIISSS